MTVLVCSVSLSAQNLTILHLNDTHSHIEPERAGTLAGHGGVIEQAAYVDSVRTAEGSANVMLLHAGDFSQGSSYFTELGGDLEIDIINAMAYDAVCLGNHEFDNGINELARRLTNIKVPVVCANYNFKGSPLENLIKPYTIMEKAGRKIGVIGLLTDLSDVVSADVSVVIKYQNPKDALNLYAAELKSKGCDLVIALTHLGYEGEAYTDFELASVTRNVDIIVGGHSHTDLKDYGHTVNLDGKKVIIVTDGKWGLNIGKLTVK